MKLHLPKSAIGGLLAFPAAVGACDLDYTELEGYTVISVTEVDGEFEGCDFDKRITFVDGTVLECSTYGYDYAYQPDAIIFAKRTDLASGSFVSIKLLVDDELYDMAPKLIEK